MEDVFRHRLQEAGSSRRRVVWVWIRALSDLGVHAVSERFRGKGRGMGMQKTGRFTQDVGYAVRALLREPGLAVAAVLTLALGIGAATGTFSVVYSILLQDLPYEDADRLVAVWPTANANRSMVELVDDELSSLDGVSGISAWTLTLNGVGEPLEITGTKVSPNHFDLLGVAPALGRGFNPEEDVPGASGVVVLSHAFWLQVFGGDPGVLGRVVEISGADHDRRTVIGVMPSGFRPVFQATDVWIPLDGDPTLTLEEDDTWYVNHRIARLSPGATVERATEELGRHARGIVARLPRIYEPREAEEATVEPLLSHVSGDVEAPMWVALGAVSLVLLIACGNVANLLLARSDARARSLAVRVALGATRGRLARMLLAESLVLGVVGGALGVLVAYGMVQLLVGAAPETFPRIAEVGVSTPVLFYALTLTLGSVVLAGLGPALRASRIEGTAALGGGGRGSAGESGGRVSRWLVTAQVALAMVVAVGSGLMLRSLGELLAQDTGMDGERVLTFRPSPPVSRYPDGESFRQYYDRVSERVAAIPGVTRVGAINLLPGTSGNWSFPTYAGADLPEGAAVPSSNFRAVRPGYFEAVKVPLLSGRLLHEGDQAGGEPVLVVNQSFADRFWPGDEPLGQTVRIFNPQNTPTRVVGVVGDVRQHSRSMEPQPEMYFPHAQVPWNQMSLWLMVEVEAGDPLDLAGTVRAAVWDVDPEVPISGMDHLSAVLERSTRQTRFLAGLLTGFGLLAVVLGGLGVFGVTAFTVGRRMPEFGVRVAMGATRRGVMASALRKSLIPVGAGVAAGALGAAFATGLLESVLFGVGATDPVTFATVAAVLCLVAVLATLLPAWRASRVDPVAVLAGE